MFRRDFATLAVLATASAVVPALAQVQRSFPQNALRGSIVFADAPEIGLNGNRARLAPGARIRDASNMQVTPGSLGGGRFVVHYTLDLYGLVGNVWILRPDEIARRPWPTTPVEAQAWSFDPVAQVWTRP